ncbi:MAG: hypothetical protein ACREBI_02010 [Nitrosotalea sp.]
MPEIRNLGTFDENRKSKDAGTCVISWEYEMAERDCIEFSISQGQIWRHQIVTNCSKTIPKATLYRRLSPTEGDRDLCKIIVRKKVGIETEVESTGGKTTEHDDIMQNMEGYLIRSKALDTVFARRSNDTFSFELLETLDNYAKYCTVRVRSTKALENCTASVTPISGIIKNDVLDEYHTLWKSKASGTSIDLNPGEPADAYLLAMPAMDSTWDKIEHLKQDLELARNETAKDHVQTRIQKYSETWAAITPPCYLVGQTGTSPQISSSQSFHLPVPLSYKLADIFPHVLVFTVYSSKGSAWIPFLLERESRSTIMPHIISEYQSRGGPHWLLDNTKRRPRNEDAG